MPGLARLEQLVVFCCVAAGRKRKTASTSPNAPGRAGRPHAERIQAKLCPRPLGQPASADDVLRRERVPSP